MFDSFQMNISKEGISESLLESLSESKSAIWADSSNTPIGVLYKVQYEDGNPRDLLCVSLAVVVEFKWFGRLCSTKFCEFPGFGLELRSRIGFSCLKAVMDWILWIVFTDCSDPQIAFFNFLFGKIIIRTNPENPSISQQENINWMFSRGYSHWCSRLRFVEQQRPSRGSQWALILTIFLFANRLETERLETGRVARRWRRY